MRCRHRSTATEYLPGYYTPTGVPPPGDPKLWSKLMQGARKKYFQAHQKRGGARGGAGGRGGRGCGRGRVQP